MGGSWSNTVFSRLVVVEGSPYTGLFFYSPTAATGNLVGSWTAQAGVDPYGNAYPAGLSVANGNISGGVITGGTIIAGSITAGSIGSSSIINSTFNGGTVNESMIVFDNGGGELLLYATSSASQTFTSSGTFTVPSGVTSVNVQAWGGGGGAESGSGSGGGGGEYAQESALAVTPGDILTVTIGSGGSGGTAGPGHNGGTTTITGESVVITAHGGGGSSTSQTMGGSGSTNSIHFNGGGSTANTNGVSTGGAGGGSSGGTSATGNDGSSNVGQTGGAGGVAPSGGGNGGAGGNGSGTSGTAGTAGSVPGGGGGAGGAGTSGQSAGGHGGKGEAVISYTTSRNLIGSASATGGTDASGDTFPSGFMGTIVAVEPGSSPAVPEVWHLLSALYVNGWTDFGGGEQPGRYRLDSGNRVWLDGDIKPGTYVQPTTIFTLPSGYRPVDPRIYEKQPVGVSGGCFTINVLANGAVQVSNIVGAAPAIIGLSGISFPID